MYHAQKITPAPSTSVPEDLDGEFLNSITYENTESVLQYIGGYIARKIDANTYSRDMTEKDTKSWIYARSNGNLLFPTDKLMQVLKSCEGFFNDFHGQIVNTSKGPDDLVKMIMGASPHFDEKVVKLFCFRLHSRIKYLNQQLREKKMKKGTRHYKQLGQFLE